MNAIDRSQLTGIARIVKYPNDNPIKIIGANKMSEYENNEVNLWNNALRFVRKENPQLFFDKEAQVNDEWVRKMEDYEKKYVKYFGDSTYAEGPMYDEENPDTDYYDFEMERVIGDYSLKLSQDEIAEIDLNIKHYMDETASKLYGHNPIALETNAYNKFQKDPEKDKYANVTNYMNKKNYLYGNNSTDPDTKEKVKVFYNDPELKKKLKIFYTNRFNCIQHKNKLYEQRLSELNAVKKGNFEEARKLVLPKVKSLLQQLMNWRENRLLSNFKNSLNILVNKKRQETKGDNQSIIISQLYQAFVDEYIAQQEEALSALEKEWTALEDELNPQLIPANYDEKYRQYKEKYDAYVRKYINLPVPPKENTEKYKEYLRKQSEYATKFLNKRPSLFDTTNATNGKNGKNNNSNNQKDPELTALENELTTLKEQMNLKIPKENDVNYEKYNIFKAKLDEYNKLYEKFINEKSFLINYEKQINPRDFLPVGYFRVYKGKSGLPNTKEFDEVIQSCPFHHKFVKERLNTDAHIISYLIKASIIYQSPENIVDSYKYSLIREYLTQQAKGLTAPLPVGPMPEKYVPAYEEMLNSNQPGEQESRLPTEPTVPDMEIPSNDGPNPPNFHNIFNKSIIREKIKVHFSNVGKNMESYFVKYAKDKIEGRCRNEGYVRKHSCKVITHTGGIVNGSTVVYNVVFLCEVCVPFHNMEVDCMIKNKTKLGIVAIISESDTNPMTIYISKEHHKFDLDDVTLNEGDKLKVTIVGYHFEKNDPYISAFGILNEANIPERVNETN